ncbi:hypothetical protein KTGMC3_P1994 [Methanocalculus sp. MC3]
MLLIISIVAGLCLVTYLYFKKNQKALKIAYIFIISVWLILQVSIIVNIEYQYQNAIGDYQSEYADAINTEKNTPLNASWLLTEKYYDGMHNTYGQKTLLPNRAMVDTPIRAMLLGANPLLLIYFCDFNSQNKLVFLQKTGNCGEFAGATALMIRDVTGMNTRIIEMEGADHALPEIYYEDAWWVFDKTYTTSYSPIKARDYASHLSDTNFDLYLSIADLKEIKQGESTLIEHGFNASNVTISALFDTINDSEPNTPLANTNIEVYTTKYRRDPLVYVGTTDINGECNLVLNVEKEYVIIGNNGVHKGIKIISLAPLESESIILLLY